MLVLEKHNLLQASHHFFWLADSLSAAEKREGQDVSPDAPAGAALWDL